MEARKQVVILRQLLVVIGDASFGEHELIINNASFIRRWQSTAELAEIAKYGLTCHAVFDPVGMMYVPYSAIVARIDCEV